MNTLVNRNTVYATDLLEAAGFDKLAKIEKAISLGFKTIKTDTVRAFSRKLRSKRQEFAFHNVEDYKPGEGEVIPTTELKKVAVAKQAGIFDKILVVGTKVLRLKRLNPDPLVIGLIFDKKVKEDLEKRGAILRREVLGTEWYLIAAWK